MRVVTSKPLPGRRAAVLAAALGVAVTCPA